MENIFFLHISLAIPSKDGQLLFKEEENKLILQQTVANLKNSTLLDKLIIVCPENEYNEIFNIIKEPLASLNCKSDFLKIPDTSIYAINTKNLHFNSTLLLTNRVSGLFSFSFFLEQAKIFNFNKAILAWADLIPSINATTVDYLLDISEEPLFFSYKIKYSLFVLPKQKTVNLIQESISELIQSHKRKVKYFEGYASEEQLENLNQEKFKISSIYSISRKMNSVKPEFTDKRNLLNPFLPLYRYNNYEPLKRFLLLINKALDPVYKRPENITNFLTSTIFKELQKEYKQAIEKIISLNVSQKQRFLIEINNNNKLTTLSEIKEIFSNYSDSLPPIIEIGNLYNPLKNELLGDIINYLKNKTDFLIINIRDITEQNIPDYLFKISNLIINIRVTDQKQLQLINNILANKESTGAKVFLETIFTRKNENFIHSLFQSYEYIADHINVLPDQTPAIKLAEESKNCKWSTGTLTFNHSGDILLCEESERVYKNVELDELTKIQGCEKECEECYRKNTASHLWSIKHDQLFFIHKDNDYPDLIKLLLPAIFSVLKKYNKRSMIITDLLKFLDDYDCKIDFSTFYFFLKDLFTDNNYSEMLNISEYILKGDPVNPKIWDLIEQVEEELK